MESRRVKLGPSVSGGSGGIPGGRPCGFMVEQQIRSAPIGPVNRSDCGAELSEAAAERVGGCERVSGRLKGQRVRLRAAAGVVNRSASNGAASQARLDNPGVLKCRGLHELGENVNFHAQKCI